MLAKLVSVLGESGVVITMIVETGSTQNPFFVVPL